MCKACDDVRRVRRIDDPDEYYRVVDDVRARISAGSLRLLQGSCALSQIGPGQPWPARRMSHVFLCRSCGARFQLTIEPFEGKGGAWTPMDGAALEPAAPSGLVARLSAVEWKTVIAAAAISSGWWLTIVGVVSVIGFPIVAWLTPVALLMAIPLGRHCAGATRRRPPDDRRLNALVAGGLMGSDMGLILAIWAAFIIPAEAASPGIAVLLLVLLAAAGAAGGVVLAGYGAVRAMQTEGEGARVQADSADG